jgi:hypothetical protein
MSQAIDSMNAGRASAARRSGSAGSDAPIDRELAARTVERFGDRLEPGDRLFAKLVRAGVLKAGKAVAVTPSLVERAAEKVRLANPPRLKEGDRLDLDLGPTRSDAWVIGFAASGDPIVSRQQALGERAARMAAAEGGSNQGRRIARSEHAKAFGTVVPLARVLAVNGYPVFPGIRQEVAGPYLDELARRGMPPPGGFVEAAARGVTADRPRGSRRLPAIALRDDSIDPDMFGAAPPIRRAEPSTAPSLPSLFGSVLHAIGAAKDEIESLLLGGPPAKDKDPFFLARAQREEHRLRSGEIVRLPFHFYHTDMMTIVGTADFAEVDAFLRARGLHAVPAGDRALIMLIAADHKDTSIGPYKEFLVCIAASREPISELGAALNLASVSAFNPLGPSRNVSLYLAEVDVTTPLARDSGIELLGIAKDTASKFHFNWDGPGVGFRLQTDKGAIEFSKRVAPFVPVPGIGMQTLCLSEGTHDHSASKFLFETRGDGKGGLVHAGQDRLSLLGKGHDGVLALLERAGFEPKAVLVGRGQRGAVGAPIAEEP